MILKHFGPSSDRGGDNKARISQRISDLIYLYFIFIGDRVAVENVKNNEININ